MNYDLALKKVEAFEDLCEKSIRLRDTYPRDWFDNPQWKAVDAEIDRALSQIEAIAQEVDPRLAKKLRSVDPVITHQNKRDASRELWGAINTMGETADILGPQGPKLAAQDLHPWVWNAAAALWSDGHRRAAVQAAATALFDTYAPAKLGLQRDTRGGADLMGKAFSKDPPGPGAPRLRFTAITLGTPEWNSAHEGAMKLGQGAAQAIRNLTTHDLSEPDEQEALEMLAVLSYVARLVDKADVDT